MKWLLGIDLGTNSLGWWAYEIGAGGEIHNSLDGGVRIFPDGREPSSLGRVGESKALERRLARSARRNREHKKVRFKTLVRLLIENGLLPSDVEKRRKIIQNINPYEARAQAAERIVEPYILGRALFSIGQRRGYKSNRKEASDEDGGKLKERMEDLKVALDGKTLGAFLWDSFQRENGLGPYKKTYKSRPEPIRFSDNNSFFAPRELFAEEFKSIRAVQGTNKVSPALWEQLATYILDQRRLKPVERGRCSLFIDESRHWADTPIGHDFRIYQELNNLKIINPDYSASPLNKAQYDAILNKLLTQNTVSFTALRKLKDIAGNLLFDPHSSFNLEGPKRKGLNGHSLRIKLAGDPHLEHFLPNEASTKLNDVFELLHKAETDELAIAKLREACGLTDTEAKAFAKLKLNKATANLSRKAMEKLVEVMKHQGLQYWEAVEEITDDNGNSVFTNRRLHQQKVDRLPYYGAVMPEKMLGAKPTEFDPEEHPEGHYGRINNPSVHVALNQIRKLVNTLTDRFDSAPETIHIELTRDLKLPKDRRQEEERKQAKNEKRNDEIRKKLAEDFGIPHAHAMDIKKYKLWEELGKDRLERLCVYTGKVISAAMLFNGEAEIEHILPFSSTLDDGMTNLTLSLRWANRLKGNMTPHDAFASGHHAKSGIIWEDVLKRVSALPKNKRWRFAENALAEFEKNNDFIARQLNDTAYMTRITAQYLSALEGVRDVIPIPGRLTSMIRGKWRLNGILADDNQKSREDHRHHAVDAAVVGLINRNLLAEISRLSGRGHQEKSYIEIPPLAENIEEAIRMRVPTILPSFKPDHSLQGKIYKETAYGFTEEKGEVVTRKPIASLTAKETTAIRDETIRSKLAAFLAKNQDRKLEDNLREFGEQEGIKRVRIIVQDQTIEPIKSAPYKGYSRDSFICCDIWKIPSKKKGGNPKYEGKYWGYADVKDGKIDKLMGKPHAAAKFITRVFKNDILQVGVGPGAEVFRVAGFSTTNNRLDLRNSLLADPPRQYIGINVIGPRGLKRLHVTMDGRIRYGNHGAEK